MSFRKLVSDAEPVPSFVRLASATILRISIRATASNDSDSCMYSDFTKMAHGNPRVSQKERFRQRFMHKLVYYPMNNDGLFSCVGCGRCLSKCPISMNIVKVMKKLGEGKDE